MKRWAVFCILAISPLSSSAQQEGPSQGNRSHCCQHLCHDTCPWGTCGVRRRRTSSHDHQHTLNPFWDNLLPWRLQLLLLVPRFSPAFCFASSRNTATAVPSSSAKRDRGSRRAPIRMWCELLVAAPPSPPTKSPGPLAPGSTTFLFLLRIFWLDKYET